MNVNAKELYAGLAHVGADYAVGVANPWSELPESKRAFEVEQVKKSLAQKGIYIAGFDVKQRLTPHMQELFSTMGHFEYALILNKMSGKETRLDVLFVAADKIVKLSEKSEDEYCVDDMDISDVKKSVDEYFEQIDVTDDSWNTPIKISSKTAQSFSKSNNAAHLKTLNLSGDETQMLKDVFSFADNTCRIGTKLLINNRFGDGTGTENRFSEEYVTNYLMCDNATFKVEVEYTLDEEFIVIEPAKKEQIELFKNAVLGKLTGVEGEVWTD